MNEAHANDGIDAVVETIRQPVWRYLRRYTGDPALAEDLLQETLVRVARGLPGFDGRAKLTTWAFAIATHVAADHFRRPEHRQAIVDVLDVADAPELADGERLIDDRLVIGEMNACIREVIDSLPEDYRAALVLHDLEEMSAKAVAEICGISLATAKIRIHRARNRLREALKLQCAFYRDDDNVFRCSRKPDAADPAGGC